MKRWNISIGGALLGVMCLVSSAWGLSLTGLAKAICPYCESCDPTPKPPATSYEYSIEIFKILPGGGLLNCGWEPINIGGYVGYNAKLWNCQASAGDSIYIRTYKSGVGSCDYRFVLTQGSSVYHITCAYPRGGSPTGGEDTLGAMAIGSLILENSVKLSKNPSEGPVNLTLCLVEPGDAWISVYDHTGSLIKREGLGFLKAGEHPYSLSLSPGIYFLIAQVGQWSETKRVIVR
ncbi:MAG: hypothetical protein ABIM74_03855 [candidate division WOR-3 bacterium]